MSINLIIILSVLSSFSAIAWVLFMTQPGDIFDFVPGLVDKILPYQKYKKIHKVTYYCERCIAGQIGLWSYIIYVFTNYRYYWLEHLFTVFLSIFFAGITSLIINKLQ